MVKRINNLIEDISRNGYEGIGKPEPLKYGKSGYWSRRIDDEHRIVGWGREHPGGGDDSMCLQVVRIIIKMRSVLLTIGYIRYIMVHGICKSDYMEDV